MSKYIQLNTRLKHPELNVEITTKNGIDQIRKYLEKPLASPDIHPDIENKRKLALLILDSIEMTFHLGESDESIIELEIYPEDE